MRCSARYRRYGCEPLSERHIQAMWYDADIRPDNLTSRRGERVRVIDPGRWNLEAGPDFLDAVLEVGSDHRRLRGDIEVHLNPSDWTQHGHGDNPAYRNVIAHVTWRCGPEPASLPSGSISIWIGRFMTANIAFSPDQIDLTAYPFAKLPASERPCASRLKNDPDLAQEVMSAAGSHRIETKAWRISRLLFERPGERRQIFYEETMNALGYRKNSHGFRRIARIVPYERIEEEPEIAAAAMIAASEFVDWNRTCIRPSNSPAARLAAAAQLFTEHGAMRLLDEEDYSVRGLRNQISLLVRDRLVGRGRAGAILVNVAVPFAIAEGRITQPPPWLPPEDISEPVRLTAYRMFGRDHNPALYSSNGLYIQGLIQIHRDFCLQVHPDCGECRLVTRLGEGAA